MKVTLKLIIAMIIILILSRSVEGILTVQRETYRLNQDIRRDSELLGRIIKASVQSVWLESGREEALHLVESFNLENHPVQISWEPFNQDRDLLENLDIGLTEEFQEGDMVSLRKHAQHRGEIRYTFIPLDIAEADGFIRLTEILEERSRYIRHAIIREIVSGGAVIAALGGAILLLGYTVIGHPLNRLQERITSIGEGNLQHNLVLGGRDELSMLAGGLNAMCKKLYLSRKREIEETEKRLETMEQMRHMDRLTTIGRLASGVAHELGTPLNVIIGRAGMLIGSTDSLPCGKVEEIARTIRVQADRMSKIIQRLLDFSRQRPPRRITVNGADIVRQAVELVSCLGYFGRIHFQVKGNPEVLTVKIDPVQIQQVLTNLIENAMQAMASAGNAFVSIEQTTGVQPPAGIHRVQEKYLKIIVQDEGPGILEENLPNIFDPFFTTKKVGEGTGLGLSIAYGIVREHGGWIEVESTPAKGSCFSVFLPQEVNE
jgi:two-component system, NtrC family, sensor kinase